MIVLPCHIEAPPAYMPKARYALRMLLLPLGIAPQWVDRDERTSVGLYYGAGRDAVPEHAVRIPLAPEACAYFEQRKPYRRDRVRWRTWEGEQWPVLFGGEAPGEDDLVASTFFWLAGWDEYTTKERDIHGRYLYRFSLHAGLETGTRPVVDAYREQLVRQLTEAGIGMSRRTWAGRTWAFCPTHDIDYLRKWRPGMIYREVVEHFLLNRMHDPLHTRVRRLGAFLQDWVSPGDVFRQALRRIVDETERKAGRGTYFFKTHARGPNDVYYAIRSPFSRRMIRRLEANDGEIGLHPSYHAHVHPAYLDEEKRRLQAVSASSLTSVRQHFLRYDEVNTPRIHEEAGFRIDSTLAFADHEGFRRGTCHPFQLFDVCANKALDLWEMPLCLMDGALFNRRRMTGDQAVANTAAIMRTCRRFGGVCVGLWHNTLWDEMDFPEWGDHFLKSMDLAVEGEARIDSLRGALQAYLASV